MNTGDPLPQSRQRDLPRKQCRGLADQSAFPRKIAKAIRASSLASAAATSFLVYVRSASVCGLR
jgi:hypothetical protein